MTNTQRIANLEKRNREVQNRVRELEEQFVALAKHLHDLQRMLLRLLGDDESDED